MDKNHLEYEKIINVDLRREMEKSYIDYSMSVIVGRALPDVRDGLKPVHRRILYTMYEDNLTPERPYRKSATTVGDVLGRYHPHGDAAVYDSMVRMAQDFSLRYPLVDGHGNFGSVDGDPAAAYRYTEAKMSKLAVEMLTDIEKETIDYTPNYDGSRKEPLVLPSRFPNLLVNGSSGIAVGMATNIPPHNLVEVIDAAILVIDNPNAELADLMEHIKGPDFPTAGTIHGKAGIHSAYATGRGRVKVRARAEIMDFGVNRFKIVVTELPYMVNKARLIENIADLVKDKQIEGISDLRDESDRNGMSMVIELKRDANPQVVLNLLYKHTQMQTTFAINMLALVNNQPKVLTLREMLDNYVEFQKQVIVRRTQYDLKKARDRAHILEGLKIAIDNIDRVIKIIRANKNITEAKQALMDEFDFSEIQAQAIVDMRLGRLTGLEREKIEEEYKAIMEKIAYFLELLESPEKIAQVVKDELTELRDKFGDPRRTDIEMNDEEIDMEDLIDQEDCVYTMTHFGYIKRLPTNTYRAQHRGGKGITAMATREEDFVETLFVASTHDHILFFTNKGRLHRKKGYQIPEASRTAKGMNIINLLPLEADEKVTAMLHVPEFDDASFLVMATKQGIVKRIKLSVLNTARKAGIRAISILEDDDLIDVSLTDGNQEMILATHRGMAIRFKETDIRPTGRDSQGVFGIDLESGDFVIGAAKVLENATLLTVTEKGYGKRVSLDEYKTQKRYGRGLINHDVTEKTGNVAGISVVEQDNDVMLISNDGVIIRMAAESINMYKRNTQGVILMRMEPDVSVISIAKTAKEEELDEEGESQETPAE